VANAFADNTASFRLMERVGMRREAHAVGESLHRSGEWLDTVGYAVSADEWDGLTSPTGRASVASSGPTNLILVTWPTASP